MLSKKRITNYEYELYEGLHEPIITQDQWDQIKRIQANKYHAPAHVTKELMNPFVSLLVCEKCGARMRRNVPAKTQQTSPWYRCPTRGCNCRSIKCDFLETKVVEAMSEWLSEYSLNITPDSTPIVDPTESALVKTRERLQELHHQQDNICEYLEKGIYTVEMFTKRNDILTKEIRKLQSQEADLVRQHSLRQNIQNQTAEIIPATQQILDSYPLLSTVEKNNLWKIILEKITVFRTPSGEFSLHLYPKLPMKS